MGIAGYIITLLCLAMWGTLAGWRNGLLSQTGSVLGVAFGIGGSRILLPEIMPQVEAMASGWLDVPCPEYLVSSLAVAIIVGGFYLLFALCGIVLRKLLSALAVRPIDSVLGAAFGLFKWLFLVSVAYNTILGFSQDGPLFSLTDAGDGNPVELVMPLAPALIGYPSPDEMHHRIQLLEARGISLNNENNDAPNGVATIWI